MSAAIPTVSMNAIQEQKELVRDDRRAEGWRIFMPTLLMVLYTGLGIAESLAAPAGGIGDALLGWGVIAAIAAMAAAVRACRVRPLADEEAVYLAMNLGL